MRHLLNPLDFSVEEIDSLLSLARDIEKEPAKVCPCLRRQEAGNPVLRAKHQNTLEL